MLKVGEKVKFIVVLPIGKSGVCEGIVKRILAARDELEGPSFLVGDIIEDGEEMCDYRIDTEPDGSVSEDTIII